MKTLFISFSHDQGFGNCTKNVDNDYEIHDADSIRALEKWITQEGKANTVVILNIQVLPIK